MINSTDLAALQELVELAITNDKKCPGWSSPNEMGALYGLGPEFVVKFCATVPALSRLLEAGVPEGWTKCSERMPDNMQKVLVFGDGKVCPGWYDEPEDAWEADEIDDGFFIDPKRISHWRPYPAAPTLPPGEGEAHE